MCVCKIEHDLQPMLDLAQEAVVVFQDRALLVRQAAGILKLGDGLQRVAGAQLRQVAAVEQLQELDDELDVADAAAAGFHVAIVGPFAFAALFDPPLEGLDAADVGPAEIAAINPGLELLRAIPGPDPRSPATGRALMKACRSQVRPQHVVIVHRAFEADHDRATLPFGPQPQIDAVDRCPTRSSRSAGGPLRGPGGRRIRCWRSAAGRRSCRRRRREKSGRYRWNSSAPRRRACPSPARRSGPARRRAREARRAWPPSLRRADGDGRLENRVGQIGNLPRDGFQPLAADDVAVADPQRLAALEPPQRRQHRRFVGPARPPRLPGPRPAYCRPTGCPSVSRSRS